MSYLSRLLTAANVAAVVAIAFTAGRAFGLGAWEVDTWGEMASQLPPCPTEDSVDCYWDAEANGNLMGDSFVALANEDGSVTLFFEPVGRTMVVIVDAE